jgi:hypothetical protein
MDFLTPELFNFLVIANLIVGLLLIAFRFYHDMTRKLPEPGQHREQVHDESSHAALEDTDPNQTEIQLSDDDNQVQNSQNS